ncbi:MAG: CPBP family intramembrane metalloprotease [Candidatus Methanoplasma sp.]|jgi:hypothetical protein|nr:CPBP family intramembrane metalloprotease [Candidatus Methanoplasma sp.]
MADGCPECERNRSLGHRFCSACGRSLESGLWEGPLSAIMVIAAIAVAALAVVEAVSLAANAGPVFEYIEGAGYTLFILAPKAVGVIALEGIALQAYWILLIAVILACVAYSLVRFTRALAPADMGGPAEKAEDTAVFWVAAFVALNIFVTLTYNIAISAFGHSIDSSWIEETPERKLQFLLADAGVWEEIAARVVYIGAPMAVIALAARRGAFESLKCLLGGFGMSKASVALIIVSAAIFGLAHMEGWGFEKVPPAMVMGAALGYLFVRFGLYAAILAHFVNDYMSAIGWLTGSLALEAIVMLCLLAVGAAALAYILKKLVGAGLPSLPLLPRWKGPGSPK